MSVVSAKKAKAGGNWKKLQKTLVNEDGSSGSKVHRRPSSSILNGGKGKHKAVLEVDSRDSSSSPAPSELPWFAEDLSPEDLALVRSNSGRRSTGSTQATTTATASSSPTQSADDGRKRQIILGGGDGLSAEKKEPGTYVAIDCEMVGVGPEGSESVLARVSIVNWHGALLLDTFVQPKEKVTDYRTWVSGVRAEDLQTAPPFEEVQKQVAKLIKGRVLVGHAIHNDLNALLLSHPKPLTRDTAQNKLCRELAKTKHPSLKKLVALRLGIDIQLPGGGHSSLEDARATMALYRTLHADWQKTIHSSGAPNAIIGRGWKKRKSVDSSTPRSTKAAKTEEDPEWWKHL